MADELTTDACGQPLPPACVPGTFDLPACYTIGGGPVLPGFQQITRDAACVITATQILDINGVPVVGGTLAACPGSGGGGGGGGAVTFPLLAPDGSCAAPSYSFTTSPTSGMWMNAGVLTISANNCDDFIELGASVNIGSNTSAINFSASTSIQVGAGTTIDLLLTSHLSLNAVPGVAGQVLTTNGPGLPPSWQAAGGGSLDLYAENPVAFVAPSAGGNNSVVIGSGAFSLAAATDSVVFGTNAQATQASATAIGANSVAQAGGAFAAAGGVAISTNTIAIGSGANAIANSGIAIGQGTNASSSDSIAIGRVSVASTNAVAIGQSATAGNTGVVAVGNNTTANGIRGVVIGNGASGTGAFEGVAIGSAASVTHANSVALGGGAISSAIDQITLGRSLLVEVVPGANGTVTLGSAARGWEAIFISADNGYRASAQTTGAGASLGTLTNAPSAGDPAFWLRVVINGVNHFIPAWT